MSGTVTAFSCRPPLLELNWTCIFVPAFGTLNTPAHLVSFGLLDKEVRALSRLADA